MKRFYIILYAIGLLVMSGCRQEEFIDMDLPNQTVKPGDRVKLDFSLVTSDFNLVSTRMTSEQENQWNIVWVAQFDSDGNRVGDIKSYPESAEKIDIVAESGENTLYFITNVDTNPYTNRGSEVSNLTELQECIFSISDLNHFDTASKLVMVGVWKGNFIPDNTDPADDTKLILKEIVVFAKRLTSKINIVVEASLPNVSFQNKKITVDRIQLCAAPLKAFYKPDNTLSITSGVDVEDFEEEVFTEPDDGVMTYRSKPYYVLENMQGIKEHDGGAAMKGKHAPKDSEGRDLATYVKIRAYIEDGLSAGFVDYRVYLGKNADKDFNIERNYHYTITIKIQGKGPDDITADFRVESRDDLHQLQLQTPNGTPATTRGSETQNIDADKEYWGWDGKESSTSKDHLRVFTNGAEWTLDTLSYITSPTNATYVWEGLHLEYCAPGDDKWYEVVKDAPVPSNAKIRLKTGINSSSYDRIATFKIKLYNVPNSVTREWKVRQYKAGGIFNVPSYSFFPGEAGIYAIAVRSEKTIEWKFESKVESDSQLKFIGTVGTDGFSDDPTTWQKGHGAVLFKVGAHGNITKKYVYKSLNKVTLTYKIPGEENETATAVTNLYQLPLLQNLLDTRNVTTGYRFAYEYSSDPMFTTVVGFNVAIPWSLNMLDGDNTKYDDNKGLIGTTSPVNGKENTLRMFNLMDRKAAERLSSVPADVGVKGPIFSPAGICMSLNENYWEIDNVDDPRYQWYLPSRNEGLMDAFIAMLGLNNGGEGTRTTIWTSTVPASTIKSQSAYFAGMGVDISANYSVTSAVRCIRRKTSDELSSLTYPHLRNVNGTPVIIVREDGKGFVDKYRAKPGDPVLDRYYNIAYPLRYSSSTSGLAKDANGPISTLEMTMSPKFQVAKKDASDGPSAWFVASGWAGDLNFKELADDPATGCQNYIEIGENNVEYNDWRLPTEMELRLIGLLGAGTSAGTGQQHILQNGGVHFTDIPGFTRMSGSYWTGTEYISKTESNQRATYVTIYDLKNTDAPIRGTAIARKNAYKIRCVRDIDRNSE